NDGRRRIAEEPLANRAVTRVQPRTQSAERPAVIGDRDEKACRKPVQRADLAPNQAHVATKPHGADSKPVHSPHDRGFELRESRVWVYVVESPEEVFFGMDVPRRTISANAHTDCAGTAALALRLPDRVQNALSYAFECAIGATQMRELGRK